MTLGKKNIIFGITVSLDFDLIIFVDEKHLGAFNIFD